MQEKIANRENVIVYVMASVILILIAIVIYKNSIVERGVQWNFGTDGRSMAAPGSSEEANKQVCLAKAPRSWCIFIRATDIKQEGFDAPINLTCVYSCLK